MKIRVLIADSSKTQLKSLSRLVEEFGYAVLIAQNEEDVFQMSGKESPELILLDLSLPGLGGIEISKILTGRRETRHIPVILLTQRKKIEDKIAAFDVGVQDVLTRPFHPEELRIRILSALRAKERIAFLEKENRRLEEQIDRIQESASKDSLTDLLSRTQFVKRLNHEVSRSIRYHLPLTLCSVDIDHFKQVHDQFGEVAANLVLVRLGVLIKESFRDIDFHCRIDKNHYLICLPESSREDAMIPLTRFHKQIAQLKFNSISEECRITASIGVSFLPNPEILEGNRLMECADRALIRAKEAGRDRIAVWDSEKGSNTPR